VRHLDARSAISGGGWDPRHAVTPAVAESGEVAAALVDTNGDGADVDLDVYERDPRGEWREVTSGNVAVPGFARTGPVDATWGVGEPGTAVRVRHLGAVREVVVSPVGCWLVVTPRSDAGD
jgi:hypothetical protein